MPLGRGERPNPVTARYNPVGVTLASSLLFAIAIATAVPSVAHAQHDHGAVEHTHHATWSASAALVAARFSTPSFVGDYQGIAPAVHWTSMRFAASIGAPLYRITKNGATDYGPGDIVGSGQLVLFGAHARAAGLALAVSAPTGSERDRLGMGHVMVMPAAWASYGIGDAVVAASFGYGRALGAGGGHADHGGGPLVDPMNFSELTWSATGDLRLARTLSAGVKLVGAVALDDAGKDRVTGGARVTWGTGRVQTTAELQGGFVGDPFEVRGVLASLVRF